MASTAGEAHDTIESTAAPVAALPEQLQVNVTQEQPQMIALEHMQVEERKPRSRARLLAIVIGLYVR